MNPAVEIYIFYFCIFTAIYLTLLTALSGLAVTISMFVLNIYHHDPEKQPPAWIKTFVFRFLGCLTLKQKSVQELTIDTQWAWKTSQVQCLTKASSDNVHADIAKLYDDSKATNQKPPSINTPETAQQLPETSSGDYGKHWKLAAAILDRFFLVSFLSLSIALNVAIIFVMPAVYKPELYTVMDCAM